MKRKQRRKSVRCPKCFAVNMVKKSQVGYSGLWCGVCNAVLYPVSPTEYIKPNPNCNFCGGSGEIQEPHPYGSTVVSETLLCECVTDQIKNSNNSLIELVLDNQEEYKRLR